MVETLFEFAPYAMVLVDPEGHIIRVNAQVELLFGYSRQELQAKAIELLVPACLRRWVADMPMFQSNAPPQGPHVELYGRRKDGSEFPIEIRLTPIRTDNSVDRDAQTGAQCLVAIFDIANHKRRAAEIAELQHRLHDRRIAEYMDLAQKLHNGPLQDLQILNFTLASLSNALATTPDLEPSTLSTSAMLAEVTQIRESIRRVSSQLRLLHQELYPPTLASFGLATALQSYVKSVQADYPELKIELNLAKDDSLLPAALRAALYHVCQQALKNIGQHAHARHVKIRLQSKDEQIVLEITDDGCGFDVPQDWVTIVRQGRLGLSSAQERTEAVSGRFQICSAPGKGTTISVIAPIKPYELHATNQL
jgi:PAS domain S-box-containing protein